MATLYEWYQTTLIFLKDNKVLLLIAASLLGGNIYQASGQTEAEEIKAEKIKACDCNIKQHLREHH